MTRSTDRKRLLGLALLAAAAFLPRLVRRLRQRRITLEETARRVAEDKDFVLLDVRTAADYHGELGHIKGSLNIPLEELEQRLEELTPHQARPIGLICTTDRRSSAAARLLRKQGFADVAVVSGGIKAWSASPES